MNKKICIVGLGLIGGSLGMAIKQRELAQIIGLTREASKIGSALGKKAIDFGTINAKEAVKDADIIFMCYPIHLIVPEIKKILKFVKHGAIITDVGSTKEEIIKKVEMLIGEKDIYFIGGHPMAGKEHTGLDAAEAGLFHGKNYILTKTKNTNPAALDQLKNFLQQLGTNVIILDPKTHDEAVAGISHMLIAIAAAAVNTVGSSGKLKGLMKKLASSGFRDTTRIASGDPMLAVDMFVTNKKSILSSLKKFRSLVSRIEGLIKRRNTSELRKELHKAKTLRDSIFKNK